MKQEQKEGIILLAALGIVLFVMAMLTDWTYGFWHAQLGYDGIRSAGCANWPQSPCTVSYRMLINFTTVLMWFSPLLVYAVLRSLGIVRRLFKWEKSLARLIPKSAEEP